LDLRSVYFEIRGLPLPEYRLPQFVVLLEYVLEGGVLIRLLLGVAVARLVLRVALIKIDI
jgi:hypothetical protein